MRAAPCALGVALLVCGCEQAQAPYVAGTVERDRMELAAFYAEPIASIEVTEGQSVKAGDLLVVQRAPRLEAQHRRAQAVRDQAAARLAELVRGPRQELIKEAVARLDKARAQRAEAETDLGRVRDLFKKGVIAQSQVDSSQAAFDAAAADADQAKAALDALVAGTTAEELDQARHALDIAEAEVAEEAAMLERLEHRAPVDGTIDALPYKLGETPPVGMPVVVLLAGGAPYARVYIPEPLRVHVQPGTRAQISVDGTDQTFEGRVRFVSSDATFTPYYALTQHDRSRLAYVSKIDLVDAEQLPSGLPVQARFPDIEAND